MKHESTEKQLRRLLWNALSDYVSASYYVYICAEICPNKKPADIHNCYMNCKTCNSVELTRKLFYSRLKSLNKNKKSIMVYYEQIQKSYTLLMEKHIKANAIVINKNLVYVPQNIYCVENNVIEFPPMICGLEIKKPTIFPKIMRLLLPRLRKQRGKNMVRKYGKKRRKRFYE